MDFTGLGTFLGIVATLVGLMVILGAGWVTFKGSFNKATIIGLREDNTDLRNRVTDLELESTRLKTKTEVQEGKIISLQNENTTLKDMITQRAQVDELKTMLAEHHTESLAAWSAISRGLGRLQK